MKKIALVAAVALLCGVVSKGQTNCSSADHSLFVLPEVHLRALPGEVRGAAGPKAERRRTTLAPQYTPTGRDSEAEPGDAVPSVRLEIARMTANTSMDDFDPDLYHHLEQSGCFTARPTGLEAAFRPAVIHLGKTELTCSLYTAIKRKNPLCLINPVFLNFSW